MRFPTDEMSCYVKIVNNSKKSEIKGLIIWRFSSLVEFLTRYTEVRKIENYMKNFNPG